MAGTAKPWWTSKTIWANLLALIAIILNGLFGVELDAETQAALATSILAVLNIALRVITTQPIRGSK